MQQLLDVPAPAKLNLFLHITGRRADGYHLLQSAFMLIDCFDRLHFERLQGPEISRCDLGAALPENDLILRAARLLQQSSACRQGVRITTHKHIPSQAGLGGGSSDAASTLIALNRLWRLGLERQQLATLGLQLGADLPFFIHGKNAWVQGIGEKLQSIELPPARFMLIKPPQGNSTQQVFKAAKLARWTRSASIDDFMLKPYAYGRNDLQDTAARINPAVAEALDLLARWGLQGRMSGTGSTVFAPLARHDPGLWQNKAQHLLDKGWELQICNNLMQHPLYEWL